MLHTLFFGLSLLSGGSYAAIIPRTNTTSNCNYLPGDAEWPSTETWSSLNDTVGGRLIANVPLAEECHDSDFSSQTCKNLQNQWIYTEPHMEDPASFMAPYWQNNTCSPFPNVNPNSCTLGNYPSYSINVSKAEDAVAGVKFAKQHNIRLIVKNTGHDYQGRSNGKGALSIWTHHLKDFEFMQYNNSAYSGNAVRMGAGVQGFDALAAGSKQNQRILAGYCPTVGTVGGFSQTAGFGAFSASYGLGSDQALEWEVVTTEGEHLKASADENQDLYWALSGGGAGAYAVVISLVAKTHADGPIGGAYLSLNHTMSDAFFDAFAFYQTQMLDWALIPGFQSAFQTTNSTFALNFISWPGHNSSEVAAVLKPFTDFLQARNLTYNLQTSDDPNYLAHFTRYQPDLPYGPFAVSEVITSRLIPRSTVETSVKNLTDAHRAILSDPRFIVGGAAMNVSHERVGNSPADNAVLPAWRDALYDVYSIATWDPQTGSLEELAGLYHDLDNDVKAKWRALTPGSGSYMNEDTFTNPEWKEDYFGNNYDKLLEIKRKYDPDLRLYGIVNPGNEFFTTSSDGRLCRI